MIIPFFIAYFYGVTHETDAFFFSYAFVFFAAALFQQVFESVLIPYLAEQKKIHPDLAGELASFVAWRLLPLVGMAALCLGAAMNFWLQKASGLSQESVLLAVKLFFEMIPFLLLAIVASAINGVFNTHKIFWYPALSPLLRSMIVILCLFLFHQALGVHALALGFCLGEAVRWFVSVWILRKHGFMKNEKRDRLKPKITAHFWRETGLQVFALTAIQVAPLMNQWFATWLSPGNVTLMSYADRLAMIPSQIYLAGVSQIFLSRWSDAALEQTPHDFRKRVLRDTVRTVSIAFLASLGLWFFRHAAVLLAYGRGDFPMKELPIVAEAFGWLMLGFAPAILTSLYLRVLFVFRKPLTFCLQSWGRLLVQGVLSFWLVPKYGIAGLAMSTTLSGVLSALWMVVAVERLWNQKTAGQVL